MTLIDRQFEAPDRHIDMMPGTSTELDAATARPA
jgi:hypothetical protein